MDKNTLPFLSIVIKTISLSGATFDATELGVTTVIDSEALNFVVRIKKLNNKKATSHIAVMSIEVLFLGNLGLDIKGILNYETKLICS